MASAGTTDNLGSDSSTNERPKRSDVMNLIFVQQMAQYRQDDLAREAAANRAAAQLRRASGLRLLAIRPRLIETAGRLRLALRGSAA